MDEMMTLRFAISPSTHWTLKNFAIWKLTSKQIPWPDNWKFSWSYSNKTMRNANKDKKSTSYSAMVGWFCLKNYIPMQWNFSQ